jgi:hypothetical protein
MEAVMNRTATEELILSTPHKQPPTPSNPGVRPSYRDMQITALAQRLYTANTMSRHGAEFELGTTSSENAAAWYASAEAAVDELIDRPEREFKQQLAAVVASNEERDSMGSWAPATASGWL